MHVKSRQHDNGAPTDPGTGIDLAGAKRPRVPFRKMLMAHPSLVLGYGVAALMLLIGAGVTFGMFLHAGVPEKFRIMFGLVLTLMGGYRFVLTRTRQLRLEREDEDA